MLDVVEKKHLFYIKAIIYVSSCPYYDDFGHLYHVYKNTHNFCYKNMVNSLGGPTFICDPKVRNERWSVYKSFTVSSYKTIEIVAQV